MVRVVRRRVGVRGRRRRWPWASVAEVPRVRQRVAVGVGRRRAVHASRRARPGATVAVKDAVGAWFGGGGGAVADVRHELVGAGEAVAVEVVAAASAEIVGRGVQRVDDRRRSRAGAACSRARARSRRQRAAWPSTCRSATSTWRCSRPCRSTARWSRAPRCRAAGRRRSSWRAPCCESSAPTAMTFGIRSRVVDAVRAAVVAGCGHQDDALASTA